MPYQKQSWVNGVSPVSAARLNHIEDGIAAALLQEDADGLYTRVAQSNTPPPEPSVGDLWLDTSA